MINRMACCGRKDVLEFVRTRKGLFFNVTLLCICAMVLGATKCFPALVNSIASMDSGFLAMPENLDAALAAFFPSGLKENMGILASDIAVFYGIVVILSTSSIIGKEIREGKWIFLINAGYTPFELIVSKGLVYGIGAAFPCFVSYNLYFFIGRIFLYPNYLPEHALMNSLILSISLCSLAYLSIVLSAICKHGVTASGTLITIALFAPDIFSFFSFGKFLPTYLLTYVYQSSHEITEIIIPFAGLLATALCVTVWVSKKAERMSCTR